MTVPMAALMPPVAPLDTALTEWQTVPEHALKLAAMFNPRTDAMTVSRTTPRYPTHRAAQHPAHDPTRRRASPPAPRRRGTVLLWLSTIVLAISAGPLLLYVVFGPADGNPIGLGLLFFFGAPPSLLMLAIALGLRASDNGLR